MSISTEVRGIKFEPCSKVAGIISRYARQDTYKKYLISGGKLRMPGST